MPRSGTVADMEHDSVYVGLTVLRTQRALHGDLTGISILLFADVGLESSVILRFIRDDDHRVVREPAGSSELLDVECRLAH